MSWDYLSQSLVDLLFPRFSLVSWELFGVDPNVRAPQMPSSFSSTYLLILDLYQLPSTGSNLLIYTIFLAQEVERGWHGLTPLSKIYPKVGHQGKLASCFLVVVVCDASGRIHKKDLYEARL